MFKADAVFYSEYDHTTRSSILFKDKPCMFRAGVEVETQEQAKEIAAKFPKYVKVKVSRYNYVSFYVQFASSGVTGEHNETGIKRLTKFLEIAGDLHWECKAGNGYETFEEFKKNIGI